MKHGSDRKPSRGNGGYPDNERNYHSMPPVEERSHRDGCRYCGHDKRSDYYNMRPLDQKSDHERSITRVTSDLSDSREHHYYEL